MSVTSGDVARVDNSIVLVGGSLTQSAGSTLVLVEGACIQGQFSDVAAEFEDGDSCRTADAQQQVGQGGLSVAYGVNDGGCGGGGGGLSTAAVVGITFAA